MKTLLALETADTTCGVALWHDGACRGAGHIHRPRVHAARLVPLINETLCHAEIAPQQVDAVAVSAGPGSYTGLRIGMSTAKGIAMAHGLPLIPVPTLDAAAYALAPWTAPNDIVVAALDARRSDVFAAAYAAHGDAWTSLVPAGPYDVKALADSVFATAQHASHEPDVTLWCTGPGAEKAAGPLQAHADASGAMSVRVVPASYRTLSARHVARRAQVLADNGTYEAAHTVEPAYLKAFHGTPASNSLLDA